MTPSRRRKRTRPGAADVVEVEEHPAAAVPRVPIRPGAERAGLLAARDEDLDPGRFERLRRQPSGERDDDPAAGRVVVRPGYVDAADLALGEQAEAAEQCPPDDAEQAADPTPARERLEQGRREDEDAGGGDPSRHPADEPGMEDQTAARAVHVGDEAEGPSCLPPWLDRRDHVPASPPRQRLGQRRLEQPALGDEPGRGDHGRRQASQPPPARHQRRQDGQPEHDRERRREGRVSVELLGASCDAGSGEAIGQGGGSGLLLPSPGRPPRADLLRELGDRRHCGVEVCVAGGGIGVAVT